MKYLKMSNLSEMIGDIHAQKANWQAITVITENAVSKNIFRYRCDFIVAIKKEAISILPEIYFLSRPLMS